MGIVYMCAVPKGSLAAHDGDSRLSASVKSKGTRVFRLLQFLVRDSL
jgi:hypothetical protein